MSTLGQVVAAREAGSRADLQQENIATDLQRREVLTTHAKVPSLEWLVFTERPVQEAYEPLYKSALRSSVLLLAALGMAVIAGIFLARRMVVPIRALRDGAVRIGGGDLSQRIAIKTGDELEALGEQFNRMASQLQDLYATLERKVQDRTSQLELANRAKSRFLAVASHDLRQPLHALGLFVAQLNNAMSEDARRAVVARVEAALAAMNELFNALLDISKLDAGVLAPNLTDFPVARLLKHVETAFAGPAQQKGLMLRVVNSSVWVRSDFIRLEQIVFNLVSNAIRYTSEGAVLIGCRHQDGQVKIEVFDTGHGIPQDQHRNIFAEFYRIGERGQERGGGLGLGLAIVDRLCRLLEHPITLRSTVGTGSCFSVAVPRAVEAATSEKPETRAATDVVRGRLIVVLDNDLLVLEGMDTLLRSWGYRVITGATQQAILARLEKHGSLPDLIIADYRLAEGETAAHFIERLHTISSAPIPAILVSGDTNPELEHDARVNGYHLLHKPLDPMTMRALVTHFLKKQPSSRVS
jgi:signal transduction histidine kinase